jgi:integrase
MILFLAETGCRRAEAAGLKWADIEWDRKKRIGHARVLGKGSKVRRVHFTARTWKAVKAHKAALGKANDNPYVFPGCKPGEPLTPKGLGLAVARIGRRAGVPLHTHQLGHTFARAALRRGAPVPAVQKILGHASPTLTMGLYGSFTTDMAEQAYLNAFVEA